MNQEPRRSLLASTSRARFVTSLRDFASSTEGPKSMWLFAGLLLLLVTINSLNVVSSYIGRDFMTAVADRDTGRFASQTLRYVSILLLCTVAAVIFRWVEERLGLLWRHFLTNRLVDLYLRRRFYHRLGSSRRVANPDQRIADDVRAFTQTTLSFLLMILNATLTVIAFSGVMWTISPLLFAVAVTYALAGSLLTIWFGKPLVWINYNQFDREAEFRADLVQLRENSEFIALAHHEDHFRARLARRIDRLVTNYRKLIAVNRNLNFFTNGYSYFTQLIPVLVVAPLYMRGQIEFGVITQSTIAFAQLLGAFSLIVTQFQSISSFTAVAARLDRFSEAARESETAPPPPIEVADSDDGLHFEHLTLEAAENGTILVEDLSLKIERGTRLLVTGPGGMANMAMMALFRATADLWDHGRGRIVTPGHGRLCFLPERPYLPPGTLREVLLPPVCATAAGEDRLHQVLRDLDLEQTLTHLGGLDIERDWDDVLSLGELQRFAIARVLLVAPDFAMLDRVQTTLEPERMRDVLGMLDGAGITYVTIGRSDSDMPHYDMVLELAGNGPWTLHPAKAARPVRDAK
ncbi:MAG: ABC transporter ATP-binding protein/permease [Candidatus Binatia bacterium]